MNKEGSVDLTDTSVATPAGGWERLILYLSVYALTVALTGLLWPRPVILTMAFALFSVLLLWRWHSRSDVAYFCLAMLLGPLGEFVAVGFGAWEYSRPWVNIPIWLPLAYGITGLFLYRIAGWLLQFGLLHSVALSAEPLRVPASKQSCAECRCQ